MTSHPKDATKELIDVMAENPKIAKAFHLPLQSGSNRILQRMNRHYTTESYLSLVSYMRKKMPDIALTSDIIVGFPGETEEDFEEFCAFLKEVRFDRFGAFAYSREEDTPAYDFENQVDEQTKQDRLDRLMAIQMEISAEKAGEQIGKSGSIGRGIRSGFRGLLWQKPGRCTGY